MDNFLEKAIHISGGVAALARSMNINSQAVSQWKVAPTDRVLAIAKAAKWKVTPHQLRADIYPDRLDGLPENLRLTAARLHDESVSAE